MGPCMLLGIHRNVDDDMSRHKSGLQDFLSDQQSAVKALHIIAGSVVMALTTAPSKRPWTSYLWAFSLWLESIAVLPQLFSRSPKTPDTAKDERMVYETGRHRFFRLVNCFVRYTFDSSYRETPGLYVDNVFMNLGCLEHVLTLSIIDTYVL